MNTRKMLIALALGAVTLSASACNTVDGAGDDLKSASREVKKEI